MAAYYGRNERRYYDYMLKLEHNLNNVAPVDAVIPSPTVNVDHAVPNVLVDVASIFSTTSSEDL